MKIRNISDHTITENLFGRTVEIPVGWTIDSKEFWGTESGVDYLAIKHRNELKVMDDEGNELSEIQCPCCGAVVDLPVTANEEKPKSKRVKK